jgi:hypothetical protein
MKAYSRIILALSILVLAAICGSGCSSITIQSNKDATAVHKVERLYILINHGDVEKQSLSLALAASFKNCLSNSPVQLMVSIASPLELDERAHDKEIASFRPDAVLVVQVKTFIIDEFNGYPKILYDASLYPPTMNKRLWRAGISNSGGQMKRRMRDMTEKIVQQLRQDGFL